jgi:hypothetical protein
MKAQSSTVLIGIAYFEIDPRPSTGPRSTSPSSTDGVSSLLVSGLGSRPVVQNLDSVAG